MTPEVEKTSTTATTPARSDVQFSSGSDDCHAWLYLPGGASASGPVPVIVMAHGFSGVKQMRLDAFAERFCAAGLCVPGIRLPPLRTERWPAA